MPRAAGPAVVTRACHQDGNPWICHQDGNPWIALRSPAARWVGTPLHIHNFLNIVKILTIYVRIFTISEKYGQPTIIPVIPLNYMIGPGQRGNEGVLVTILMASPFRDPLDPSF